MYAWYAVLHDLREKGMRTSLISVVLYNRAVKLPLLPLLVHYFGLAYTVVLAAYLIGFSIIGGLIMEKESADTSAPLRNHRSNTHGKHVTYLTRKPGLSHS